MMKYLQISLFTLVIAVSAFGQVEGKDSLKRDGFLRLYHSHLDDFLEVQYETNGVVQEEGLNKINRFMRSRDSGKEIKMNLELIRLLDHIQDHFQADTVEIISGYRSREFNGYLKKNGRGVAENSYHTLGMATDIHLDEIVEKKVKRYARKLRRGGVGYYPDLLMVHLDVGVIRHWQEDEFTDRRNIGIFNKDLDLAMTTDHLFYYPGHKQKLVLSNQKQLPLKPFMQLDWFYRGKWRRRANVSFREKTFLNGDGEVSQMTVAINSVDEPNKTKFREFKAGEVLALPYGKFRWKIRTQDGRIQYSNEFYLKRK